jgi:hypothetical protein
MSGFSLPDARRDCAAAAHVNRQARQDHDVSVPPVILELRTQGLSLTVIGGEMMARGYFPRRGTIWHKRQLLRVIQRGQEAANAVTVPLDEAMEPVTLPAREVTESVTVPALETAESVTVPGDVHRHDVQQPVT